MDSQGLSCFCDEPVMVTRKQYFRSRIKNLIEIPDDGPRYMKAMIPFRILIFVLTFVLLALLVYLVSLPVPELRDTSAVLLIGVTCAFLFFAVIHVIGHFGASENVEFPMIFGSFVGVVCFTFIGAVIAYAAPTRSWARLIAFVMCFCISFLHAADVLLAIGYWRHKYSNRRKCGPPADAMPPMGGGGGGFPMLYQPNNTYTRTTNAAAPSTLPPLQLCKCDVHTSMTGVMTKERRDDYQYETPNTKRVMKQKYNMECPKYNLATEYPMIAARSMQTEANPIQREVQTTRIDVKEIPVQTGNKCDLCHRLVDSNQISPRQYGVPTRDISPTNYQATNTTISSSNITNQNTKLPIAGGSTSAPCCGACECSLQHPKNLPVQYQPQPPPPPPPLPPPQQQHVANLESIERQIVSTDPNYNLNTTGTNVQSDIHIETIEKKQIKEPQQIHNTRPPRTKPLMGRLASISGCLAKSSSSSVLIRKNKRTQTKVENVKKNNAAEANFQNAKSGNTQLIGTKKSAINEIEVQSVSLSSTDEITKNSVRSADTGSIDEASRNKSHYSNTSSVYDVVTNESGYVNMNAPRGAPKNQSITDEHSYVNMSSSRDAPINDTRDANTSTTYDAPKIQTRDMTTGSTYAVPINPSREINTSGSYDSTKNLTRGENTSAIYDVPKNETRDVNTGSIYNVPKSQSREGNTSAVYDTPKNLTREENTSAIYDVPKSETRAVNADLPRDITTSEERSVNANLSHEMPREELRNDNLTTSSYETSKVDGRIASMSSTLTSTGGGFSLTSHLSHGLTENEMSVDKLNSSHSTAKSDEHILPIHHSSIYESPKHGEPSRTSTSPDEVLKSQQSTSSGVDNKQKVPEPRNINEMADRISDKSENTSKRTKTLYREPSIKSDKNKNERKDDSAKLDNDPGSGKQNISDKFPMNQTLDMRKRSGTSIPLSSGEKNISTRFNENVTTKYDSPQQRSDYKTRTKDEIAGESYKRPRANSGSLLFRPTQTSKNPYETIPVRTLSTPRPSREISVNKPAHESRSSKEEVAKLFESFRRNPHDDRDDFDRSIYGNNVNIIGNKIRRVNCPVCSKSKRPCSHCSPPDRKN